MPSLKELIVKIGADTRGLDKGIDDSTGKLTSFGSMFGGLAAKAAAATAVAGAAVGAVGFEAIQAGAKLEQSNIAFNTLLGSAEKAGAFLKDLSQFASTTPFEFQGLQDSAKQMLAFGFEAKEIIPTLTGVGDALSAVGKVEALPNVILQLGQMQAKGKANREELNILAEHGIPVWQLLADTLGTTVSGAMDRVGKGALSADQAISALLKGIENSNAGGAMAAQMESLNGAWSNVMDTFTQAFQRLGLELIPSVGKPAADVAKQIVDAFATVVDAITGVETETTGLKTVWGVDLGAMSTKAKSIFNEIKTFMGPVFDQIVRIVETATAIVKDLMAIPGMKESVEVVWIGIKAIVEGTWIALKAIITGALTIIEGALKVFHSAITLDWQTTKDGVALIVEGMWTAIKGVFSGGVTTIKNTLVGLKDSVLGVFSDIGDELVGNSIVPDEIVDPTIAEFGRMKTGATVEAQQLKTSALSIFGEIGQSVSNLKLGDKLFAGGFSLENVKTTLKSMGDAFKDKLMQPAKDAINNLIDQGIKILMGALDGLIGKLGGVGGAFSSVFGAASGGGGAVGGGASSAGGAASAAGSGAMGVVTAVTGAITAGSSVWGNFQNMEIETGIDAIEKETRETKLWIETNVVPALWQINEAVSWGAGVKAVEALLAHVSGPQFQILGGIMEATSWGPNVKANERAADEVSGLRSDIYMLMAKLDQIINRPISIQVDGRELALVVGENQEALGITA